MTKTPEQQATDGGVSEERDGARGGPESLGEPDDDDQMGRAAEQTDPDRSAGGGGDRTRGDHDGPIFGAVYKVSHCAPGVVRRCSPVRTLRSRYR